jgi:hypothetical protein
MPTSRRLRAVVEGNSDLTPDNGFHGAGIYQAAGGLHPAVKAKRITRYFRPGLPSSAGLRPRSFGTAPSSYA